MRGKPKKGQREKDLTSRYMSGGFDEDRADPREQFRPSNKRRTQEKIARTADLRSGEEFGADIETLPIGQVVQVHSLYCDVEFEGKTWRAVVRRTLTKISGGYIVVGDRVRFRPKAETDATIAAQSESAAEAVIEQILPRDTVLTRSDSFKAITQQPIVANAEQMLIVASLRFPTIKWGLIDRMLVAAQSGQLTPIICLNKIDLAADDPEAGDDLATARSALEHYESMGIRVLRVSAATGLGIDDVRQSLSGRRTVLAGHSGVGKSSLVNALVPTLDLRTAALSGYNGKGRHTTTSARRFPLPFGGAVIDTPGVKLFGLWGVTADNLSDFFPDVSSGAAPEWRQESYERILQSLGQGA